MHRTSGLIMEFNLKLGLQLHKHKGNNGLLATPNRLPTGLMLDMGATMRILNCLHQFHKVLHTEPILLHILHSRRFLNKTMHNLWLQPLHSNLLRFLKLITGVIIELTK